MADVGDFGINVDREIEEVRDEEVLGRLPRSVSRLQNVQALDDRG